MIIILFLAPLLNHPSSLTHSLQLLFLLNQQLQHQIDVCQVQVLLVRTQHVLEDLPPGPILAGGGGGG